MWQYVLPVVYYVAVCASSSVLCGSMCFQLCTMWQYVLPVVYYVAVCASSSVLCGSVCFQLCTMWQYVLPVVYYVAVCASGCVLCGSMCFQLCTICIQIWTRGCQKKMCIEACFCSPFEILKDCFVGRNGFQFFFRDFSKISKENWIFCLN